MSALPYPVASIGIYILIQMSLRPRSGSGACNIKMTLVVVVRSRRSPKPNNNLPFVQSRILEDLADASRLSNPDPHHITFIDTLIGEY